MRAIAVLPGKPNSIHLAELPKPSVHEIPSGRGIWFTKPRPAACARSGIRHSQLSDPSMTTARKRSIRHGSSDQANGSDKGPSLHNPGTIKLRRNCWPPDRRSMRCRRRSTCSLHL